MRPSLRSDTSSQVSQSLTLHNVPLRESSAKGEPLMADRRMDCRLKPGNWYNPISNSQRSAVPWFRFLRLAGSPVPFSALEEEGTERREAPGVCEIPWDACGHNVYHKQLT